MNYVLTSFLGTAFGAFLSGTIVAFSVGVVFYNLKFVGIINTDMSIIAMLKDLGYLQIDTYPAEIVAEIVKAYKQEPENLNAIDNIIANYQNSVQQDNLLRPGTPDK